MYKCRPLRWLFGFLVLWIVWVPILFLFARSEVEEDLKTRAQQALEDAGLAWARLDFEGRDGVISGTFMTEKERSEARNIVGELWGVRVVEDRAKQVALISPYTWSAKFGDDRLRLKGYVHSEDDRRAVLGFAKANFPGLTVDDRMNVSRSSLPREAWLSGISFSLKQLSYLKRGVVRLSDYELSIIGDPKDIAAYKAVYKGLNEALPKDVRLKEQKISLALAKPFHWTARYNDKMVSLEGFVPSISFADKLRTTANKHFAGLKIAERLEPAAGAPKGWSKLVLISLKQLKRLELGELSFSDNSLKISGTAKDQATLDDVLSTIRRALPQGFKFESSLAFIPPPAPKLPTIDPYWISLKRDYGRLQLTGYVPNDDARAEVLRQIKLSLPDLSVSDRLELGLGAPDFGQWMGSFKLGLGQLRHLATGHFKLSGFNLSFDGIAKSIEAYKAFEQGLSALPTGLNVAKFQIRPPAAWPYILDANFDNGRLNLSGHIPSEADQKELFAFVASEFPQTKINNRLKLASGEPQSWLQAIKIGLGQLGRLENGSISLDGLSLKISGLVQTESDRDQIHSAILTGVPLGYSASLQVKAKEKPIEKVEELPPPPRVVPDTGPSETSALPGSEQVKKVLPKEEETPAAIGVTTDEDTGPNQPNEPANSPSFEQEAKQETEKSSEPVENTTTSKIEVEEDTADAQNTQSVRPEPSWVKPDFPGQRRKIVPGNEQSQQEPKEEEQEIAKTTPNVPRVTHEQPISPGVTPKEKRIVVPSGPPVTADKCQDLLNSELAQGTIRFARASWQINTSSEALLDQLAATAGRCPDAAITISGHTDSDGSDEFNKLLSIRRAEAVVNYLVGAGIDRRRLQAVGYGETKPLVANNSSANKAKNRRIEFKVEG